MKKMQGSRAKRLVLLATELALNGSLFLSVSLWTVFLLKQFEYSEIISIFLYLFAFSASLAGFSFFRKQLFESAEEMALASA